MKNKDSSEKKKDDLQKLEEALLEGYHSPKSPWTKDDVKEIQDRLRENK